MDPFMNPTLRWQTSKHADRVNGILKTWEDTPYQPGQQAKQVAVDCVRFGQAVIDEMRGTRTELKKLPQDAALHDPETCYQALAVIMRLNQPLVTIFDHRINEDVVQLMIRPCDGLVTGPENGGPGHLMIVGGQQNEIWHADGARVCRTGIHLRQKLFRVYRLMELH